MGVQTLVRTALACTVSAIARNMWPSPQRVTMRCGSPGSGSSFRRER
jgi:hypothetical protein